MLKWISLLLFAGTAFAQVNVKGKTVDATVGYTYQGGAPNNQPLCGNGSVFVPTAACGTVANPFYQYIRSGGSPQIQRFNLDFSSLHFVVTDNGTSTAVAIANPLPVDITGHSANLASTTQCPAGQSPSGIYTDGTAANCGQSSAARVCNGNGCYMLFPDGTIYAWGNTGGPSGGSTAAYVSASFPITINNAVVTLTPVGQANGDGNPHPVECYINTQNATGFQGILSIASQIGGSGYANISGSQYCSWHAFGNQ